MNITPIGKNDKTWGYEIVWSSNDYYCGKLLVFEKPGAKTATLIHKDRRKSWFVNAGKFKITFTDIKSGKTSSAIVEEGKTVDIAEMSPHAIEAMVPNSIIFEVGTPDRLDDQFRLTPDDAVQKSGEEPK
jgi:mannose-6-phosphate isomerase-like protein (cupin superfamily)